MHTPEDARQSQDTPLDETVHVQRSDDQDVGTESPSASAETLPSEHEDFHAPTALPLLFAALADVVARMEAESASTTAAGVSLRLRRRVPHFTPRDAGFRNFKSFLQAAAKDNYVRIVLPEESGHVDILVSSSSTLPARTRSYVRFDQAVWSAAVRGNDKDLAFDRKTRQVRPRRGPQDDAVPLPALRDEEILDLGRSLAAQILDDTLRSTLESTIDESNLEAFRAEVKSQASLARKWSRIFRDFAVSKISDWATTNAIKIDDISSGRVNTDSSESDKSHVASRGSSDEFASMLRSRLHDAIDAMPLAELLQLRIPAGYLVQ